MRRFYSPVKNFVQDGVTLDTDETRHLKDVLRLTVGDEVSVFDGAGREYRCEIIEIGKKQSSLKVIEETSPAAPESICEITIAATVLNGEKYDLIVQKAVELGVVKLVPMHTVRCEVKIEDAAKRLSRWRRIASEATKQTGRAKIMEIAEPIAFDKLIASGDNDVVMFSERDGLGISTVKAAKKMTAIFGPKGGWDDVELKSAHAHGAKVITLGGRILRAETAAIALTAILQHRFGDLN